MVDILKLTQSYQNLQTVDLVNSIPENCPTNSYIIITGGCGTEPIIDFDEIKELVANSSQLDTPNLVLIVLIVLVCFVVSAFGLQKLVIRLRNR